MPEARSLRELYHNVSPLRLLLFGNPIETEHQEHARLPKILALPVFSSDAISSSVYATQQILLSLGAAGLWVATAEPLYSKLTLGITAAIILLLFIVVTSYWQTIFAYPSGGGSYIVSKENLGVPPGLVAAAALLIDYILTVSVSVAAGVQNLLSTPVMKPWAHDFVSFCSFFIVVMTIANLRGLRESGLMAAIPTYTFVGMASLMIVLGIVGPHLGWQIFADTVNQNIPEAAREAAPLLTFGALAFLVLKGFANGCAALTGVEAVSNGVQAFKKPVSLNAALTLLWMAFILAFLFGGVSWMAVHLHVVYWEHGDDTAMPVIDQLSGAIFGKPDGIHPVTWLRATLYYVMQLSTTAILLLAANTSFADFPRLSSILARDRYMPRPLSNLGDKLVFSNGIILLGLFAIILVAIFHGQVGLLISLYAVGVFCAFTLSQAGMVKHWFKERGSRWWLRALINGVGCVATGIVLADILMEKGPQGAWIVVVLVVVLYLMFNRIESHYRHLSQALSLETHPAHAENFTNTVLILVPSLHRGILHALEYARSISRDCRALHIATDSGDTGRLEGGWERFVGDDVPLVILESPYRSVVGPLLAYLDEVRVERPNHLVTVVVPEFVPTRRWHALLHNNNALAIKLALLSRPGVVACNVRYFLKEPQTA